MPFDVTTIEPVPALPQFTVMDLPLGGLTTQLLAPETCQLKLLETGGLLTAAV